MKPKTTLLLILLTFTLTISTNAQNWANTGAQWQYSIPNFWGPEIQHLRISKIGDTLIQFHNCDVLEKKIFTYHPSTNIIDSINFGKEFTFIENQRVYRLLNTHFKLLYDFTVTQGDTFFVYGYRTGIDYCYDYHDYMDSAVFVVDSTKIIFVEENYLKRIYCKSANANNSWMTGQYYTEKIGSSDYLFPNQYCLTDDFWVGPFLCYKDNSGFSYDELDATNLTCSIEVGINSSHNNNNCELFKIYVNSTCETINIEYQPNWNFNTFHFKLYNTSSHLKLDCVIKSHFNSLSCDKLPKGIYIYKISDYNNKNILQIGKIIIN